VVSFINIFPTTNSLGGKLILLHIVAPA